MLLCLNWILPQWATVYAAVGVPFWNGAFSWLTPRHEHTFLNLRGSLAGLLALFFPASLASMASYLQSLPELDEDLLEPITPPSPDADSESEESEADDSNQPSQKKRRGADKEYAQWQEFPSVEAYNEFWQTEKAEWRYNNTHEISDGDVKIW